MSFHVIKTAKETKGQSLEMEWELLPKADGTPLHIHPTAKETYRVLEGQVEININGKWSLLRAGEELTVDEGLPHTFRNPSDSLTRIYNIHSPALQFDAYFEGLARLVGQLSGNRKEKLKMSFNVANHLAMLMKKHKAEIISVNPPPFIINSMNLIGRLRGLKV